MNKKKGFTLIELLAVIVILAIIALIAVPIILNMINEARKSAAKSSALGYIDAIEYNNGFAEIEQPGYTLVTGNSLDIDDINIKLKGKKPDNGYITTNDDGKVMYAELCLYGFRVIYEERDITSIDKEQCSGSSNGSGNTNGSGGSTTIPEPVSFATDSWETIANNNTSSIYKVGDTKEISLDINGDGTPETYNLMIINMSQCDNTVVSQSGCGMVIQFKELLNITDAGDKKMNSTATNAGGWPGSKMYTFVNTTVYNKLPSDLQNVIIDTKTVSGHDNRVSSNYVSDNDKLYLLSAQEVGFSIDWDSASSASRLLDYFEGKGNAGRIKYKQGTQTAESWWLRTAASTRPDDFAWVNSDGTRLSGYANSELGVAPAFRIGEN